MAAPSRKLSIIKTEDTKDATLIEELCKKNGGTFDHDPFFTAAFGADPGLKVEIWCRAIFHAMAWRRPPYFTIFGQEDASSSYAPGRIRCWLMVNCWAETPFVFFLTFLFALPHVFRLGPGGLISFVYALVTNIQGMSVAYAETAASLGLAVKDVLVVDWLATEWPLQSKGYGSQVMNALKELADKEGKTVILYSSSPKNVPFYKRHGFEVFKTIVTGNTVDTVMFRRVKAE